MTRKEVLDQASQCVLVDRNATHGNPEDNFGTIANLWTQYLRSKNPHLLMTPVSMADVAVLMILVKVARLISSPKKEDHWIDIAGYAACGGEIATLQAPNAKS